MRAALNRVRRWRKALRTSLSLKLIGIFTGGSIVLMLSMGVLSVFGLERQMLSIARPVLGHYLHFLSAEIGSPPSIERAQALTDQWPLTIRIFDQTRNIQWASDYNAREPRLNKRRSHQRKQERRPIYWDRGTVFLRKDAGDVSVYYGLRLRPHGPHWFPLAFMLMVLLGLLGSYWLTRRLFSPIKTIETGLTRIGEGQLSHRIHLNRNDELGSLAERVNQMAEQLEGMLQAKRDLLLAISHELKSPLARSRVTLALLDESKYRQTLLHDQQEMQRLIDQIIEAERTHGDFSILHRQTTDMNTLIARVVQGFGKSAQLDFKIDSQITVNVDPVQIERLLRNLIENALRYNDIDKGRVQVICALNKTAEMRLCVYDHGPGIGVEHLARLTEAFYRADDSRERNTGGLGLGLYLCQAVVDAHEGSLTIVSPPGKGLQVECLIPNVE